MAACAARTSTAPVSLGLEVATEDPIPFHFDFRVIQYNCLSMRGQAAQELVATGLERQQVAIAGFQETRRREEGIRQEGQFWVVSSSCQANGHEGCQIWIHSRRPLTRRGATCAWNRRSFMIFRSSPRLLIVTAEAGPFRFAIATGHAPTSKSPEEVIRDFWEQLSDNLGRLPRSCIVILCIDANARFSQDIDAPDTLCAQAQCLNSELFQQLCFDNGLAASGQFSTSGKRLFSWTSPTGNRSLLDYVAVPSTLGWSL